MKRLKDIKQKHNFSFLILAHTPKRNSSRPLSKNDLQRCWLPSLGRTMARQSASWSHPKNVSLIEIKRRNAAVILPPKKGRGR